MARLDGVTGLIECAGLCKLLDAYAGPLGLAERASDNAQLSLMPDIDGNFDRAAFDAFAPAETVVVWLYGQVSGVLMTTPAGTPPIIAAAGVTIDSPTGRAGIRFEGVQLLASDVPLYTGDALSVYAVLSVGFSSPYASALTVYAAGSINDYDDPLAARVLTRDPSGNLAAYRLGQLSTVSTPPDQAQQVVSEFDGALHTLYVDSSTGTPVASTGPFSIERLALGNSWVEETFGPDWWVGNLWEFALIGGALSEPDRIALRAAQQDYYGTAELVVETNNSLMLLGVG